VTVPVDAEVSEGMTTGPNRPEPTGEPVAHDQLPLPDYDHLPLASLIQRVRSLEGSSLRELLDYEVAHGNRLPVVEALRDRLSELDAGAGPSGGSVSGPMPERTGQPASPRTVDQTIPAPSINPPSHGDPTNPAQPR
jgi:hypothetical protein